MKTQMIHNSMSLKNVSSVILGIMVAGLTACAPKAGSSPAAEKAQALAAACVEGSQKMIPPEELTLNGKAEASVGDMVVMSLSQDLSCATDNQVQWSVSSGQVIASEKSKVVAQFSVPGRYLVEAKVSETSQPGVEGLANSLSSGVVLSQATLVLLDVPVLEGPQVSLPGMQLSFRIASPSDMVISSVQWSFGDGSTASGVAATHAYELTGVREITADVVTSAGANYQLKQKVTVIDYYDDFQCLPETQIFAPNVAETGSVVNFAVTIPSCLQGFVSAVRWNFADTSSQIPGVRAQHTYAAAGVYEVTADVYSPLTDDGILFKLVHRIQIKDPAPELPPAKCSMLGEQRTEIVNPSESQVACGTDGTKTVQKQTQVVYECRYVDPVQDWVEVSRTEEVKSEGECQGQSCLLPNGSKLQNGTSLPMFESSRPMGLCASVQQTRQCENGVLSGASNYSALTCEDGCAGFGIHGSTQSNIVTGEVQVPLTCSFGEEGFFDVFQTVEDRSCVRGQVVASNSRQGAITSKGACPVYQWAPTDSWSECSGDCGGKQQQLHQCQTAGLNQEAVQVVDAIRCGAASPVVERLCDRNPGAVRREEISKRTEEAHSSNKCPKNQIGIVLKNREIVTTHVFACINHAVQRAEERVLEGPWNEEKYCRSFVAYRCSHDSLSNSEAVGRFEWMQKCKASVPVIAEFLENFDDVKAGNLSIDEGSRRMYPTFMDASRKPEKTWKAPTSAKSSCTVPEKVYISAVCVASCATPEQMIMTDIKGSSKFGAKTFIEALTEQTQSVVTLSQDSDLENMRFEATAVSSWVTELVDGDHQILDFTMRSGGNLRLTLNHPLLDSEGIMREAKSFKVGDSIVKMGGESDPIVSIRQVIHTGKVYNLFTASSDQHRNLVITGGYVNGTAFYQNEGADQMNRQILRRQLIQGAFVKQGAQ